MARNDSGPAGRAFELGTADRKIPHDTIQRLVVLRHQQRPFTTRETLIPPALRRLDADMDRQQQYRDA